MGLNPFPSFQVLQHQPSTTEMLMNTLGRSLGESLPELYRKNLEKEQIEQVVRSLGENPEPLAILNAFGRAQGISDEVKKPYIDFALQGQRLNAGQQAKQDENQAKRAANEKQVTSIEQHYKLPQGSLAAFVDNPGTALNIAKELNSTDQETKDLAQKRLQNKTMLDDLAVKRGEPIGTYDAYIDNPQVAVTGLKPAKQTQPKASKFQQSVEANAAKNYITAQEALPRLKANLENINYMRDLSQQLRGPHGMVKATFGLGKASEFDALGLAAIEPVIKVFNPVGAIPVAKINLVKEKFAPKATDPQWKIDGKLNALERFSRQAIARNEGLIQLYQQYDGSPPPQVLEQFNADSESLVDAALAMPITKTEEAKAPEKQTIQAKPGFVILKDHNGISRQVPETQAEEFKEQVRQRKVIKK